MNRKEKQIYVVDTSALIEDPDIFFKVGNSEVVVPTAAIKEIDRMKNHRDPDDLRAKAARKVARNLDMLGSYQDISAGAKTAVGSTVRITSRFTAIDDLASSADNRIVGTAVLLKEKMPEAAITLLSTDGNMRNVTRSYGIKAENYPFYLDDSVDRPKEKLLNHKSIFDDYMVPLPSRKATINTLRNEAKIGIMAVVAIVIMMLIVSMR